MVSTLCTMSFHTLSSSVTISKPPMYYVPSCTSCIKALKFPLYARFSQVGLRNFSPWNGLRHVGSSISAKPPKIGRRGKCRGKVVYASLFGVGAPEALVIGVVALLVFGPKGLAEVARNLGKTLRAFQPTIRELQEVSREFKSTLEREISLDDDPRPVGNTSDTNRASSNPGSSISSTEVSQDVPVADPNGIPSSKAYTTEDYLRITEEQLKASAAAQQDVMSSPSESQADSESQSQAQQTFASSPPEQVEPESQPQASLPDSLSSPEGQSGPESQPEVAIQESATAAPLEQKSTSES